MNKPCQLPLLTVAALLSNTGVVGLACADLRVAFIEGAPKDRFTVQNQTDCDLSNLSVEIDLSMGAAPLIFDTTGKGAGVEVFQPFEKVVGQFELEGQVSDGDQQLTLQINHFAAGEIISFTIDVDDTLTGSELGNIRVSASEMQGSLINLRIAGGSVVTSTFGADNTSVLQIGSCEDQS